MSPFPVTQAPVAFHAVSSQANFSYPQNGNGIPVILDTVRFQTGDDYNTTTGIFTVPVSGYYVFTYGVSVTETGRYGLAVRIGTKWSVYAATHPTVYNAGSNDVRTVTGTAIIRLSAGVQIWLDTHNDAKISLHGCWFAGWLQFTT